MRINMLKQKQKNIIKVYKNSILGVVDNCEKLGFVFADASDNKDYYIVSFPEEWKTKYNKCLQIYSFYDERDDYRGCMVHYSHNGYAEISLATYYDIHDCFISRKNCEVYFGTSKKKYIQQVFIQKKYMTKIGNL